MGDRDDNRYLAGVAADLADLCECTLPHFIVLKPLRPIFGQDAKYPLHLLRKHLGNLCMPGMMFSYNDISCMIEDYTGDPEYWDHDDAQDHLLNNSFHENLPACNWAVTSVAVLRTMPRRMNTLGIAGESCDGLALMRFAERWGWGAAEYAEGAYLVLIGSEDFRPTITTLAGDCIEHGCKLYRFGDDRTLVRWTG
ncbi:MAG: hypothetical protein AAF937_05640 [Planctomycetota bacterium]